MKNLSLIIMILNAGFHAFIAIFLPAEVVMLFFAVSTFLVILVLFFVSDQKEHEDSLYHSRFHLNNGYNEHRTL